MDHRAGDVASRTVAVSIVGGFLGGLVGAAVMSAGHTVLSPALPADEPPLPEREEDATLKVADAVSRAVSGRPIPAPARPMVSTLVHYGFGAAMGAAQGAAAALTPLATVGGGVGFGAAVWAGAHAIVVPALGLAPSPLRRPPAREGLELALHLVYGACAERVRRITVGLLA